MAQAAEASLWSSEVRAIKMRMPEGADTGWITSTLDRLHTAGFNTVILETNYHGYTLWPSEVQKRWGVPDERPSFRGRNVLAEFVKLAHERDIRVWCWVESLFVGHTELEGAGPVLKAHPDWSVRTAGGGQHSSKGEKAYFFVCPSNPDVRKYLSELYAELARTRLPDAIFLDYLRYPVGSIGPENPLCMCPSCTEKVKKQLRLDAASIPADVKNADWLRWTHWREDQCTEVCRQVSKAVRQANPEMPLIANVYGGWQADVLTHDTLRNWMQWADEKLVDAVSTQNYTDDDSECRRQIASDLSHIPQGMPFVPAITTRDIAGGGKQLETIRQMHCAGVAFFVYSWLTDADCATLRKKLFPR